MAEETEVVDPFAGQDEISLEAYEQSRQPVEAEATEPPAAQAETVEGEEPSKEAEQEKEQERDDKGKFTKKAEFTPEQQEAFDRAFRKREAKLRRELAEQYSAKTSAPQATAAETKPETADKLSDRPELPKLSTYKGTVEEYDKEVAEYPAKLQAWSDAQHELKSAVTAIQRKLADSEVRAKKAHPDYQDEFDALAKDIKNDDEPQLPAHVLRALQESDDPHALTYHLAKNRAEFRQLATLGPNEALRAVLKLEMKLESAKDAPAPVKDSPRPKPKPPETVGARAATSAFDPNDDKLDADEWQKQRNAQLAKRR